MRFCNHISLFFFILLYCAELKAQIVLTPTNDTSQIKYIRERINDQAFYLKSDSNDVDAYIRRSLLRYQVNDFKGCIADCNQIIRLYPTSSSAYSNRGMSHCFLKEYSLANKDMEKAIELKPEDPISYLNLAFIQTESREYKKAITNLSKALELKPHYPKAYCNRGYAKRKLGLFKEAIEDYTKALEQDGSYGEAFICRGYANFHEKNYAEAIEDLESALNQSPFFEVYDVYNWLIESYSKLKNEEKVKFYTAKAKIANKQPIFDE